MKKSLLLFYALLVFTLFFAGHLFAEPMGDYESANEEWAGISKFVTLISELGYSSDLSEVIDYGALKNGDALVIFYPQQKLDVDAISSFVVDGGRVLLADDFGQSEELLERLEIERIEGDFLPHQKYLKSNPNLPLFYPRGKHPLLEGVNGIVANHPTVIVNKGGPVVQYDEGQGFVYDMNLGRGKVIVVADASLFINQMLEKEDNKKFAENAIDYICGGEEQRLSNCTIRVLTKEFEQKGTYVSESISEQSFNTRMQNLNETFQKSSALVNQEFLFFFSLLLMIGMGVYLFSILPLVPTKLYSSYVTDFSESVPWPQSEFDWNLSRFGDQGNPMADILPMAIIKEIFEKIFLKEVGYWPSRAEERPNITGLIKIFSERFLIDLSPENRIMIEKDLEELLTVLAKTPTRHRVFLENETEMLKGDLQKYHRIAVEMITIMGRQNDYEQRTWGKT